MQNFVVDLLKQFLGPCYRHNESSGETEFDCPACAEDKGLPVGKGDGKHKLAVNLKRNKYHCWVCSLQNNMQGDIPNLIKRYGNKKILKEYEVIRPSIYDIDFKPKTITEDLKLPDGFKLMSETTNDGYKYFKALNYLNERGINKDIIKEYNIGYTTIGKYKNRIIIPSYDDFGDLNFFVSRAWDKWVKPKYLNPDIPKQEFIFNENLINWDATIYLVEGVFDHIVVPNSIPILGKTLYNKLKLTLINKAKSDIVILLDSDAKDNAINIYKDLNTGPLYNRIKLCTPASGFDPSLVFEKYGNKGIINLLRSSEKIPDYQLYF